ncbi:MAG: prolipoprotein diacylglyceryl transferase [Bacillota bacterium]
MKPILLQIGGFSLRSYGLMIALGILAGTTLACYLVREDKRRVDLIQDFLLWAIPSAVLGGRLWEVVFSWSYFSQHPAEILAVWKGGLSIQGAITGGIIALIVFCRVHQLRFWPMADNLTYGVLLGQAIGRVGCFLNGDAYGKPTGVAWGAVYQPGTPAYLSFGNLPLWPAELFEAGWDLALLAVLLLFRKRLNKPGQVFALYLIGYSFGRLMLEFLRADSLMLVSGLKVAQVTSLAAMVVGCIVLIVAPLLSEPDRSASA